MHVLLKASPRQNGAACHLSRCPLDRGIRPSGQKPPGNKVMQIAKDYDKEVYNGDIGYVDDVEPEDGEFTASFELGHTEADLIKNVMLRETVDGKFTTTEDVAATGRLPQEEQ
jgi:ATP-dependent exoDNAse (exonuclease V) alpha subunit